MTFSVQNDATIIRALDLKEKRWLSLLVQFSSTGTTSVDAVFLVLVEFACAWGLCTLLPQYVVLQQRRLDLRPQVSDRFARVMTVV